LSIANWVRELGRRCPEQRLATVDQDATIIESRKQEALRAYQGERGYQPMLAVWAEMNGVLADEFRDGNAARTFRVPAMMAPLTVAQQAYAALPETVTEYYYRGDSASHESHLINWLRNEQREGGPQETLFEDGSKVKHFAVVTNIREWKAGRLIQWHREKAGTVEGVHDVVTNELAGGVMPCKYFGANAAWLRLAVIAHNVMTALKRLALPAELLTARPKRLF
jgi:hypothetical protein